MRRVIWLALTVFAIVGWQCSPAPSEPALFLSAKPKNLPAGGGESEITIQSTDELGKPGAGTVIVTSAAGSLKDGQSVTFDSAGSATVTFTCFTANDSACAGSVRVTGTWMAKMTSVEGFVNVNIAHADAGGTGGGTGGGGGGGGMGGGTGGGMGNTDGGIDAGIVLSLSTARARIYLGLGDSTVINARLARGGPDGGTLGSQMVNFTTTVGGLIDGTLPFPDGGATSASMVNMTTDSAGNTSVRFVEQGAVGMATITATHMTSGAMATQPIEIAQIQQVAHQSTTCGGVTCNILGIKGSGFNEIAQMTFKVTDNMSRPVVGVPVTFALNPDPDPMHTMASNLTFVTPSGVTDAQGNVLATVSAGATVAAYTVRATVIPGSVTAESPTIGIRGVKPSNKQFGLNCDLKAIGVYATPTPPLLYNVNCNISLVDRFGTKVGTGTSVNFKVEAGSISSSAITKKFDPNNPTAPDEGTATVTYSTPSGTGVLPVDVEPLMAATQSPFPPRQLEPSVTPVGTMFNKNPRDGLVSIIAYVAGEEFFSDDNQNGTRDANEQFYDQGEPFVDSNDNGVRDMGEDYIDIAPQNGQWDPPNGVWDGTTTIWTETRILWVGRPDPANIYVEYPAPPYTDGCPGGVSKAGTSDMLVHYPDANLNRPQAAMTSFTAAKSGTKGTAMWMGGTILDGYGFDLDRRDIDVANNGPCTPNSLICTWRYLFGTWTRGYVGWARVSGAPATDMTPCENSVVTISGTVQNVTFQTGVVGSVQ
ncbi:MAG: hypothetical protein K1X64_12925 [Myxococcaceae bacterium]|nr:hypothetical protein [Myxococcaceae bacterium]